MGNGGKLAAPCSLALRAAFPACGDSPSAPRSLPAGDRRRDRGWRRRADVRQPPRGLLAHQVRDAVPREGRVAARRGARGAALVRAALHGRKGLGEQTEGQVPREEWRQPGRHCHRLRVRTRRRRMCLWPFRAQRAAALRARTLLSLPAAKRAPLSHACAQARRTQLPALSAVEAGERRLVRRTSRTHACHTP
eukprot:4254888-Prymnesium_polylepis.2